MISLACQALSKTIIAFLVTNSQLEPPPLSKGQVVANSSSHISEVIHLLPGHLPSAAEEPEVPILYLAPYHLLPHRH